jgi:N-methylhydantoinase B/oxoprolinase/acetone carboxylase alpha subunit
MMFPTRDGWTQVASAPGSQHTAQICSGHSQWNLAVSDVLSFSLNTQGQGGRSTTDGMDAYGFAWCASGRAPDCEQVEGELPLTVTLSQHWKDSSGPGRHRGGSGAVQQWMIHKVPQLLSLCMGNGSKVPLGQPLFGGYASAPIPGISVKKADLLKRMKEGDPSLTLDHRQIFEERDIQGDWKFELIARTPDMYAEGDLLFGFSGGGPGYGDPLDRPPELVVEDLKKKIISEWTAEKIYQVAFDPENQKVDAQRTVELRTTERKARLARGKPYDQFVTEWSKKSPPAEILEWYGSWPDAKMTRPIFRP